MILDTLNEFSDAQAITVTAASTNVIDLGAPENRAIGFELYLRARVETLFESVAEDETLTIALQTDDNAAFSSAKTLLTTEAFAFAVLEVDKTELLGVRIPKDKERYIRLYYTVAGTGDFTAGAVDAFLTEGVADTFDVS